MIANLINSAAKIHGTYQLAQTAKDAAQEIQAEKIYKMNSNENPFGTSPKAAEAVRKVASELNWYPDPTGKSLRERLAALHDVDPDNIVVAEGASVCLTLLADMVLNEGDEVIEHWPTYSGYQRRMIDTRGAVPVRIPVKENWEPDFDAMLAAITERTRLIIICNPNNPTGTACDPKALEEFISKVPSNIFILVDEAYFEFITLENYPSTVSLVNQYENLVVTRTFSKIAGLAGARIGYAVACKEMICYYNNLVNFFCASSTALAGAEAFLDDPEFLEMTRTRTAEEREYLIQSLEKMGFAPCPSQSNFIACDVGIDPLLVTDLLKQKGILIRGNLGIPRITVGDREANDAFLKALAEILEEQGQ